MENNRVRVYLRKNDTSENDKLPYFTLVLIPEGDSDLDQEWKEIGAFWKAKSGKPGYSGYLNEGVALDVSAMKVYQKPEKKQSD